MTIATITAQLDRMNAIAKRVQAMKHWRAVQAYHAAFGGQAKPGDGLDMCVIHNSIASHESGQGWREVDYSHMRRAARLANDWTASRLVTDWYSRKMKEWQLAGCQ